MMSRLPGDLQFDREDVPVQYVQKLRVFLDTGRDHRVVEPFLQIVSIARAIDSFFKCRHGVLMTGVLNWSEGSCGPGPTLLRW